MNALPPRFPITAAEIDAVVIEFYSRVREDETLAPVFFQSIPPITSVWAAHEDKIAAFWRNAILFERSYSGNPQQVHREKEAVELLRHEIGHHFGLDEGQLRAAGV